MSGPESPCYVGVNSNIAINKYYLPCYASNATNPFVSCCSAEDVCLNNGLCQRNVSGSQVLGGSGVYAGGCTNPTLSDASCQSSCKYTSNPEVVFANDIWQCCGSDGNNAKCNDPQGPTFAASPPSQLTKIALIEGSPRPSARSAFPPGIAAFANDQAVTVITTGMLMGSTATSTAGIVVPVATGIMPATPTASSAAPSADSQSPGGISMGAIVGLVLGVVSILALTAAIVWFTCVYRRQQRNVPRNERNLGVRNLESAHPGGPIYSTYSQRDFRGKPVNPSSTDSQVSPFTSAGISRFTSRSTRAPEGPFELAAVVPVRQELSSETRPLEMMTGARNEDRMAGGGPDKNLPSVPSTPSTVRGGGRVRDSTGTSRYRSIMENER